MLKRAREYFRKSGYECVSIEFPPEGDQTHERCMMALVVESDNEGRAAIVTHEEYENLARLAEDGMNRCLFIEEMKCLLALLVDSKTSWICKKEGDTWKRTEETVPPKLDDVHAILASDSKTRIKERSPRLGHVDYHEYMKSEEWAVLRSARLRKDGYQCAMCGTAKNLAVHHITYEHLGHEDLNDLITLCNDCHAKVHENDIPHD